MSKIYFACSIRGGRNDAGTYSELVQIIKKYADLKSAEHAISTFLKNR